MCMACVVGVCMCVYVNDLLIYLAYTRFVQENDTRARSRYQIGWGIWCVVYNIAYYICMHFLKGFLLLLFLLYASVHIDRYECNLLKGFQYPVNDFKLSEFYLKLTMRRFYAHKKICNNNVYLAIVFLFQNFHNNSEIETN